MGAGGGEGGEGRTEGTKHTQQQSCVRAWDAYCTWGLAQRWGTVWRCLKPPPAAGDTVCLLFFIVPLERALKNPRQR